MENLSNREKLAILQELLDMSNSPYAQARADITNWQKLSEDLATARARAKAKAAKQKKNSKTTELFELLDAIRKEKKEGD